MEFSTNLDALGAVLQICLIDLLLSGDNAILIALACAGLPGEIRRKAVLLGTGAAVLFRVVLTFAATLALRAPYIKLLGAVLLLLIAIELLAGDGRARTDARRDGAADIWRAIVLIVVADAVMSLDNVVAVAAAAQDNLLYLLLGLVLSVPILVFSSLFVVRLLDAQPLLVDAGAALLGWIAGKTAVADPAVAAILNAQSFGLVAAAPILGALYVLIQGRRLRLERGLAHATAVLPGGRWPVPEPELQPVPAPIRVSVPVPVPASVPASVPVPPTHPAGAAAAPASALETASTGGPAAPGAMPAPVAQAPADPQGVATPMPGVALRKFSPMDLAILMGVAVPLLGFVATIVYLIVHAIRSH